MLGYVENALIILFGLYLILTYKWQTKKHAEWQQKTFKIHMTEEQIKKGQKLGLIVGAGFILFGLYGVVQLVLK